MAISDLRRDFSGDVLSESNTPTEPMALFAKLWSEATEKNLKDINEFALATSSLAGTPSVRMVLLKGWSDLGFEFYTNYESPKARNLLENPKAELLIWWADMDRQIRISGDVRKSTREQSKAYFHTRPRSSQLGALASRQSQILDTKEILIREIETLEKTFLNQPVPLPENWGGFILSPTKMEFWQGQPSRLHDRIIYEKNPIEWKKFQVFP
jgi:pyridoxamine 5'-phosphate oxidase